MRPKYLTAILLLLIFTGCAKHHYVFLDHAPAKELGDKLPSSVPKTDNFDFIENAVSSAVRYPLVDYLDVNRTPRSEDVNSMDELPSSSWYTPRLGRVSLSPQELIKGPEKIGAPQLPLTVTKIKDSGSALGFVTKDARGHKYLIKLDDSDYPNLETTVNYVVNRIFWAFGYNVPEDFIVHFQEKDLVPSPDSNVTRDDMDLTLWNATPGENDMFRATASLYIQGDILGPLSPKGTRSGDLNDRIDHENLRILRALYLFSALTDHSDIRSDNTLDVYAGPSGEGHTLHYLLDFGEAFGVHGLTNGRAWDGFEHFFSWRDTFVNTVKLGLDVKPWEKLNDLEDPRIVYESETFDVQNWKETYQFFPLHKSLPDDNYWACKIISALTEEHLQGLFDAANHPDSEYSRHVIETLLKRKEKILSHFLYQVSPLESSGIRNQALNIEDKGRKILGRYADTRYEVRFFDRAGKEIWNSQIFENQPEDFKIPISNVIMSAAKDYLRLDIRVIKEGHRAERAAEFHIRSSAGNTPKLVGIVH